MRPILLMPVLAILATSMEEARACGRHRACRRAYARAEVARPVPPAYFAPARVVYAPAPATVAAPPVLSPPQGVSSTVPTTRATPVQPLYSYQATPESGGAYYYTFNDSGELVVKQWMDWLFRGGRRAGLPAPPLPIIGRLTN